MTILSPLYSDPSPKPSSLRYLVSIAAVIFTLLLRLAVKPYIGEDSPFLIFSLGIVFSAWYGGFGPGVLATVCSIVAAVYAVLQPQSALGLDRSLVVRVILFVFQGVIISYLLDALIVSRRQMAEVLAELKNARSGIEEARDKVERMNVGLEQRVEERTAQLHSTIHELEAFSYSISHDMRAPLRAIDGFSRMLQEDYQDRLDDEGRRLIDIIRHNTLNMGCLIDGLLAFSRLGRQPIDHSRVRMSELAKDAIEEIRNANAGREIQFELDELPETVGDRVLLRQVFVNLLSNAVKFSRDRRPAIVEIRTRREGDRDIFFVRDNGVGFDSRYSEKMFGVFHRLHAATEFEGTGLGLAIVQRVVHRHGGRVWAEGVVGKGATVYFSLPAADA